MSDEFKSQSYDKNLQVPDFCWWIMLWTIVQSEVSCEIGDWQVTVSSINFVFLLSLCVTPSGWSPNMRLYLSPQMNEQYIPVHSWQQDFNHVRGLKSCPLIDISKLPHQHQSDFSSAEELQYSKVDILTSSWIFFFFGKLYLFWSV